MRVEEEHVEYTNTYYICERCNYRWLDSGRYIICCPTHGDFCSHCTLFIDPKKLAFPFVICPECKITGNEIISYQYQNNNPPTGPNCQWDKILLPEPFVIVRDDSSGYWIGSKKEDS